MNCIAKFSRLLPLAIMLLLVFGFMSNGKANAQAPYVTLSATSFPVVFGGPTGNGDTFTLYYHVGGTATSVTVETTRHINVQYYNDSGQPIQFTQTAYQFACLDNTLTLNPSTGADGSRGDYTSGYNSGYYLATHSYSAQLNPKYAVYWYSMDISAFDSQGHYATLNPIPVTTTYTIQLR